MCFHVNIPPHEEGALREVWGDDLGAAAFQALVLESYREGKISLGHLARLLNLSTTIEAQQWLAKRGIALNYGVDDLDADRRTLAKHFPDYHP